MVQLTMVEQTGSPKGFWRRGRIDLTRLGFNAFQPLDKDTIIHLYDTSGKSIDVTGSNRRHSLWL